MGVDLPTSKQQDTVAEDTAAVAGGVGDAVEAWVGTGLRKGT